MGPCRLPLDPLGPWRPTPWPPGTLEAYPLTPWDPVGVPLEHQTNLTNLTNLTNWPPRPTEPLWQPRMIKRFIMKINAEFVLFTWVVSLFFTLLGWILWNITFMAHNTSNQNWASPNYITTGVGVKLLLNPIRLMENGTLDLPIEALPFNLWGVIIFGCKIIHYLNFIPKFFAAL